jgi:hypothetical protein
MKGMARVYDHVTPVMRQQILDALEARWLGSVASLKPDADRLAGLTRFCDLGAECRLVVSGLGDRAQGAELPNCRIGAGHGQGQPPPPRRDLLPMVGHYPQVGREQLGG